jgi:uncharacterized protein (TIGR02679 family)
VPDTLKEAVAFFRQDAGYERLFAGLIEKYKSLGRLGGTVKLEHPTEREKDVLSAFLRRDYKCHDTIIIAVSEVARALEETRFAEIGLKALLDGYAGRTILSNAEATRLYEYQKEQYFTDLKDEFCHPYCHLWLDSILEKEAGTRGVHRAYDEEPERLRSVLVSILKALEQVPLQIQVPHEAVEVAHEDFELKVSSDGADGDFPKAIYERLPVFASRITGDPHAFDIGRDAGRFLVSALQVVRSRQEVGYEILSSPSAEETTELLDYFGLVRDDLLNFVTCIGLLSFSIDKGEPLPTWQAALKSGSVLNVPLREIVKVGHCCPRRSQGEMYSQHLSQAGQVFVVENSGVFSAILDSLDDPTNPPPMVCTNGQFTLATLLLLDKLAENSILLYSGDFDPEGLQMAQRLLLRYPGRVRLWRYTRGDYECAISPVKIPLRRLGKLGSIKADALLPVAKMMQQRGMAGYQEALLNRLTEDVTGSGRLFQELSKS